MSAPERGRRGFLAKVLARTGAAKRLKSRDPKHKKKVGYQPVGNGPTAGEESAIGGGAGGGGAGGGT